MGLVRRKKKKEENNVEYCGLKKVLFDKCWKFKWLPCLIVKNELFVFSRLECPFCKDILSFNFDEMEVGVEAVQLIKIYDQEEKVFKYKSYLGSENFFKWGEIVNKGVGRLLAYENGDLVYYEENGLNLSIEDFRLDKMSLCKAYLKCFDYLSDEFPHRFIFAPEKNSFCKILLFHKINVATLNKDMFIKYFDKIYDKLKSL